MIRVFENEVITLDLKKSQTYDMMARMFRRPSLKALVAEVVAAQVDLCHALVDAQCVGEGLQSWHDAHGQVNSRLVGLLLQLLRYALSIGSLACPAQTWTRDRPRLLTCARSCQVLMSPSSPPPTKPMCNVICVHLVSAVYPQVTHSITIFDVNIVRNFIPL